MPELTVEQCIDHVRHTLASGNKVPAIGALRILNDAGEYLCSFKAWAWLQGKRFQLDFESGQDYVWLPSDFQELTGIDATNAITSGLMATTMQHLIELRTSSITSSNWIYYYAIAHEARHERATGTITFTDVPADDSTITIGDGINTAIQFALDVGGSGGPETGDVNVDMSASGITAAGCANALQDAIQGQLLLRTLEVEASVSGAVVTLTSREPGTIGNVTITTTGTTNATITGMSGGIDGGMPRARLEIWPDPGSDDDDAVTIYYRAGWKTLDQDTEYVSIPTWLQTLYIQLVRAFARGYEREDVASLSARCAEVMGGPLALAAVRRDDMMQPSYGELMGGGADLARGRHEPFLNYGPVSDPS